MNLLKTDQNTQFTFHLLHRRRYSGQLMLMLMLMLGMMVMVMMRRPLLVAAIGGELASLLVLRLHPRRVGNGIGGINDHRTSRQKTRIIHAGLRSNPCRDVLLQLGTHRDRDPSTHSRCKFNEAGKRRSHSWIIFIVVVAVVVRRWALTLEDMDPSVFLWLERRKLYRASSSSGHLCVHMCLYHCLPTMIHL